MRQATGYNGIQIALHWGIAALVLGNYLLSDGIEGAFDGMMEGAPLAPGAWQIPLHVYIGLAVLALVLLRIVVRLLRPVALVATQRPLQDRAAGWGHLGLYALMLAVPVLGAVTWFGKIDAVAEYHVLAVNALMLLALGHALVALFHQYVLKDGMLMRIVRR